MLSMFNIRHGRMIEFLLFDGLAQVDALVDDIREHGLREAIWTHEGKIIDGRIWERPAVSLSPEDTAGLSSGRRPNVQLTYLVHH